MWQQEYNQAKRSPELNLKYSSYSMYVYILYTVMSTVGWFDISVRQSQPNSDTCMLTSTCSHTQITEI